MMLEIQEGISPEKISEIRTRIKSFLIDEGVDEEIASDIELVLSELLTNVYKHAYKEFEGDVLVRVMIDAGKIIISIRDFGEKFSPESIPKPDPEVLAEHGYGLYIASQIMDKIEYILNHEKGTEVVLTKFLK